MRLTQNIPGTQHPYEVRKVKLRGSPWDGETGLVCESGIAKSAPCAAVHILRPLPRVMLFRPAYTVLEYDRSDSLKCPVEYARVVGAMIVVARASEDVLRSLRGEAVGVGGSCRCS